VAGGVRRPPGRLAWRIGEVIESRPATPRTRSLFLDVPAGEGHKAGQHVDVRLTAADGYQAQRSYSIASAPEEESVELVVERLDDGEVSPYLTDELRAGDGLELRGPVGGWFAWKAGDGGPLFLVAGGSGTAPPPGATPRAASSTPLARARRRSSQTNSTASPPRTTPSRWYARSHAPSPPTGRATPAASTVRCSPRSHPPPRRDR
jgi:hypothetical protein